MYAVKIFCKLCGSECCVYVYFPFCVYIKITLPKSCKNYVAYNIVWPLQILQMALDALSLLLSISSLLRKNVRGWTLGLLTVET